MELLRLQEDTLTKVVAKDSITSYVSDLLEQIQKELFEKSIGLQKYAYYEVFDEFKQVLETKGGFVSAHWDGTAYRRKDQRPNESDH
jgi:prolyl-tRNA synthetase